MSAGINKIVIAGAGQAGATVALGLRKAGFAGELTLFGDESHLPYERPQLSKDMLRAAPTPLRTIKAPADYESQHIRLGLGRRIGGVAADVHEVMFEDGSRLEYDALVIATGVKPRRLPAQFNQSERIRYLRTAEDAQTLHADIRAGHPLAIIGGGVIGLEVAAAARAAGCQVTVIEAADRLMSRSVDRSISDYLDRAHRRNGIEFCYGVSAEALVGDGQLRLSDQTLVRATRVLVGIGVTPNIEPFADLGITDAFGIRVDGCGRSAIAGIYATGDIASQPNSNGHHRIETWANAQDHAMHVVKNLMGEACTYQSPTWFWSDQGDINLQVVGDALHGGSVVRGDPLGDVFSIFRLDDSHRVTGCSTVNAPKDMAMARKWVKQSIRVDPQRLADLASPLRDCAA